MKKYVFAIVIAFGALFGLSVQAAPLTSNTVAVQTQVAKESATTKVWYYRRWGYYRPYYRRWGYYRPYYRRWGYYRPFYRAYYWRPHYRRYYWRRW